LPKKGIIYSGDYEYITTPTNNYQVNYIKAPDGLVAMAVNNQIYYVHIDHSGSILNVYGSSLNYNQSFDAWGNYRNTINWNFTPSNTTTPPDWLIRGYTGHEQLPDFGLINMNGRAYDPLYGQMLSPDPCLQFPGFSQGFARYTYCLNNPLKYTDPSGYNIWDDFKHLVLKLVGDKDIGRYTSNTSMGVNKGPENNKSSSSPAPERPNNNNGNERHAVDMSVSLSGGSTCTDQPGTTQRHQEAVLGPGKNSLHIIDKTKYPDEMPDPRGTGKLLPVHYVFQDWTPGIFANTMKGLYKNPGWKVLTYNGGGVEKQKKNRDAALLGLPKAGPGLSWDEFPYATSNEGGYGAAVKRVTRIEQSRQGGALSGLYRGFHMEEGDKFIVVPIGNDGEPSWLPSLSPQTNPFPIIPPVWVPILKLGELLLEL